MTPNAGLQLFPAPPSKKNNPFRKPNLRERMSSEPESSYILENRSPPQANNAQIASEIPRSQTSFSEAPTLVRNNSSNSHSSIQKPNKAKTFPTTKEEPVIRSIFPRYDPNLALEHQAYYPQQASPTQIPPSTISKQPYSPTYSTRSVPGGAPLGSPMSAGSSVGRFPRGELLPLPEPSSTEELKNLWKVTNGWRVSSSEGRSFCLKMTRYVH